MGSKKAVTLFTTASGALIYQLPLLAFPGLGGYAYLVLVEGMRVLIDTGSGFGESNRHLEEGLRQAGAMAREQAGPAGLAGLPDPLTMAGLTHILITHGHIDHFGGLAHVRPQTQAQVGVHELDVRNLEHYEERLVVVGRRLRSYLVEAGVGPAELDQMMQMYLMTKALFGSVSVDFTFEAVGMKTGPFEMLHVPGHCAGHVVIRLEDVLFSGDHVLEETSPHQSPEHLTLSTGLDHYLRSLDALEEWAYAGGTGPRLVLGGHKAPITDLRQRLGEIRQLHQQRLAKVGEVLETPGTIREVAQALFGEVSGYNELLAVEEAGAHVEYLFQRGMLEIANLEEVEGAAMGTVAIKYRGAKAGFGHGRTQKSTELER